MLDAADLSACGAVADGPADFSGCRVRAAREVPYAITLSEAVTEETQTARVLNLGRKCGRRVAEDCVRPGDAGAGIHRCDADLDPAVHDFLATATVRGWRRWRQAKATALGSFTLFDLASQHLSRDTTLPLQESTFRYLHVVLTVSAAPGAAGAGGRFVPAMVRGRGGAAEPRGADAVHDGGGDSSIATVGRESQRDV